jgi:hypothetical protein
MQGWQSIVFANRFLLSLTVALLLSVYSYNAMKHVEMSSPNVRVKPLSFAIRMFMATFITTYVVSYMLSMISIKPQSESMMSHTDPGPATF